MRLPLLARPGARPLGYAMVFLLLLLAVNLAVLKALPYSKVALTWMDAEQAVVSDKPLQLGPLTWDPAPYQAAAELQPLREAVARLCPGEQGYRAASCLVTAFAKRFSHDSPEREFFDRSYDPVSVWNAHLGGAGGHCVSRSALLAVALLAIGTPARVIQLLAADGMGRGHNVAEVWQPEEGWRIFDPTFAGRLESPDGITSSLGLVNQPYPRWRPDRTLAEVPGIDQSEALKEYDEQRLRNARVIYPEPWLYTRVGKSLVGWPRHGLFLLVGRPSWGLGWGQRALQLGLLAELVGLAVLSCTLVMHLRGRLSRRGRIRAHVPAEGRRAEIA